MYCTRQLTQNDTLTKTLIENQQRLKGHLVVYNILSKPISFASLRYILTISINNRGDTVLKKKTASRKNRMAVMQLLDTNKEYMKE